MLSLMRVQDPEDATLGVARLRRTLALVLGVLSVLHVLVSGLGPAGDMEWVGLLLGLTAGALALRVWWSGSVRELSVLGLFAAAQAANFVLVLMDAPLPFANRPLQVLTASLYLAPPILLAGVLLPKPRARTIILVAAWVTGGALVVEAVGSRRLSAGHIICTSSASSLVTCCGILMTNPTGGRGSQARRQLMSARRHPISPLACYGALQT